MAQPQSEADRLRIDEDWRRYEESVARDESLDQPEMVPIVLADPAKNPVFIIRPEGRHYYISREALSLAWECLEEDDVAWPILIDKCIEEGTVPETAMAALRANPRSYVENNWPLPREYMMRLLGKRAVQPYLSRERQLALDKNKGPT